MPIARTFVRAALVALAGLTVTTARAQDAALVARIDTRLAAGWDAGKVKPADPTGDATFLRRVTLDLAGRIPTAAELSAFDADPAKDKRAKVVARLLASPDYARYWATLWRQTLVPQTAQSMFAALGPRFETWLAVELKANTPYNRFAVELLTGLGDRTARESPARWFSAANEGKPELLGASAARGLLGLSLDCAQCHNHPFARWSQDQFWAFAAFFAEPTGTPAKLELKVGETAKTATPTPLDDAKLTWPADLRRNTGPEVLSAWATAKGNPYFAKNAVNRVWAHLFGTGLVEPLDDLSGDTPASHPELLDDLAKAFVESNYDLKALIATLTATRAYQLSSRGPKGVAPPNPRLFARAKARGLSGDQLYDSLLLAAGLPLGPADAELRFNDRARKRFVTAFADDRPATAQRSVLQALELLNGPVTVAAAGGKTVEAAATSPFLTAGGRVDAVFAAALSRKPTAAEAREWVAAVEVSDEKARRAALADLFWALVNSAEFGVNH